ncbi:MAG: SAM-dependent methyltransferase [Myxococcota bacterium]|nr:SAM-dependent methyltransferase [Myxococcota bacterium]
MGTTERLPSSFRDPSGHLFHSDGTLFRQVNDVYRPSFELLESSGLLDALVSEGLLVPHEEVSTSLAPEPGAYKVLRPEPLAFISYPYEWCFSQLRDAALLTLALQKRALAHGMILKDASAYNVQFRRGRPVFIDTLSFEAYEEGTPWVAYRQFCQHFLAPLALMAHTDVRLSQLLRIHIDGIPLDLASRLLPRLTRMRFSLLVHIHLHARSQQRHADSAAAGADESQEHRSAKVSAAGMQGLVESLESAVRKLSWRPAGTEWGDYYTDTNYSEEAQSHKAELVGKMLDRVAPKSVWDLGANTGVYSRIAAAHADQVVSWDIDPAAVEKNYQQVREEEEREFLPLLLDLTNPSAGIGWANRERATVADRGPADVAMALAVVHHLAISNNTPLDDVASYLAQLGRHVVIEFVPKSDSQVKRLLQTREDVFPHYTREGFEQAFEQHFQLVESAPVRESERRLYLYERRSG